MKNQNFYFRFLKTLFVFILLLFTSIYSYSQYQQRDYDLLSPLSGQDYGRAIINRMDGGYAIAGYTYHTPPSLLPAHYNWFLLRLNPAGVPDCAIKIGEAKEDRCYSLIQSDDLGYVLAGYTQDIGFPFRKKATMVKLNLPCVFAGALAIIDTLNSNYYQVVKEPGDQWIFTGYIEKWITLGIKRNKILASKFVGAFVWEWRYDSPPSPFLGGGISREEAHSICFQPLSGTYGVAAKTNFYSGSSSKYDIMLLKLDPGGFVIWKKVYKWLFPAPLTFIPNTEPRKIIAMPDGGFTVVGFTNAYGKTERDIIVFRVDASGGVMWSNTYGSPGLYEQGESITLDGSHLVITGSERTVAPVGPPNAFIMKIPDAGGAPLWTRIWDDANPTDIGYDIVTSTTGATGGYAITGQTLRGANLYDPYLWRVNIDGIVEGAPDPCEDSLNTPYRINTHKLDSFTLNLVHVNHQPRPLNWGNLGVDTATLCLGGVDAPLDKNEDKEVNDYSLKQNSPNPFNPTTTINYELPVSGFATIKVFDVSGRLISTLVSEFKETGRHQVTFDGSNLSSGIYYYKIETEGFIDVKKMILIK